MGIVAVGVRVATADAVVSGLAVALRCSVGVRVISADVRLRVAVGCSVLLRTAVAVAVAIAVGVNVRVNSVVAVATAVGLRVIVGGSVAVAVAIAVIVGVRVCVSVAVGMAVAVLVVMGVTVAPAVTFSESGADTASGPGFATLILKEPTSRATPVAVSSVADSNVVDRGTPFHNTWAPSTKRLPVTRNVNDPSDNDLGSSDLNLGI